MATKQTEGELELKGKIYEDSRPIVDKILQLPGDHEEVIDQLAQSLRERVQRLDEMADKYTPAKIA